MGQPKHEREIARLNATIDVCHDEIRRLRRLVQEAEDEAARWRRKAKKLKKRESTVILDAAPELAGLPEWGDESIA